MARPCGWNPVRARELFMMGLDLAEIAERVGAHYNSLAKHAKQFWPDYRPKLTARTIIVEPDKPDPQPIQARPLRPGQRTLPPLAIESMPPLEYPACNPRHMYTSE